MKKLTLRRVTFGAPRTFGVLIFDDVPFAVTLEPPWKNNTRSISCIPPGIYQCKRIQSPKFGDTFEILGVPNRTHILFHKGNKVSETYGCVLIGSEFGWFGETSPVILRSRAAFEEFEALLRDDDEFELKITS